MTPNFLTGVKNATYNFKVSQDFDIEIAKDIIDESQKLLVENLPTKLETFKSRVYRYVYASVAGANLNG